MIELESHPVCGYDGPNGVLFMTYAGADVTDGDGWKAEVQSNVCGGSVVYVKDPAGEWIGTYGTGIEGLALEAIRLAKEKARLHDATRSESSEPERA